MHTKLKRAPIPQTRQAHVAFIPSSVQQTNAKNKVKQDAMALATYMQETMKDNDVSTIKDHRVVGWGNRSQTTEGNTRKPFPGNT